MSNEMRPPVKSIFTPRAPEVNLDMYIRRPDAENALIDALEGSQDVVLSGESGGGKSWLYKKVLGERGIVYETVNCSRVDDFKSISKALDEVAARLSPRRKIKEIESKKAELGLPGVASGGGEHEDEFEISNPTGFEACIVSLRKKAGRDRECLLVLENIEIIFANTRLMEELGNLITLLDDEYFGKFKVRLLLVGLPSGLGEYFQNIETRTTVANRLVEIPEMSRLSNPTFNREVQQPDARPLLMF